MSELYNEFGQWLREQFPYKVQKISINAGFTCPNRDGTRGWGGCTYCNNQTFNPDYCRTEKSVTEQLEEGRRFFARKYPDMKYLAYFQAYTNTYGDTNRLIKLYEEALATPDVVGLVIGTRPDCMPDELLDYLTELNKRTFLLVEYGIESTNDNTLQRINRGHNYATAIDAITRTAEAGIITGAHLILGLPGETHDNLLSHATRLSQLPLHTIKLHQLQLIRGTHMGNEYEQHPERFDIPDIDTYIDRAIDFTERLRPDIVIERFVSQSPAHLLIAPHWGVKNHEFTARLLRRMRQRDTYQGCKWIKPEE